MATVIDQLRWALQAIAAPAAQQVQLFPSFVSVPDELVLDFDQWLEAAAAEVRFSPEQQIAIDRLCTSIDRYSGPDHPDIWSQVALEVHPVWLEFRAFAAAALVAFRWPVELPPTDRGLFMSQANWPNE